MNPSRIRHQKQIDLCQCGELSLAQAVMMDAIVILTRTIKSEEEQRRKDLEWMNSNDIESPYSFVNVCYYLKWEPSDIRKLIRLGINPMGEGEWESA